jgi:flagellar basal body-associated protein FliL
MGKETDENIPTVSESKLVEEAGPNREPLEELDASDLIEPLKTTPDGTDDQQQDNESDAPEGVAVEVQEITFDEADGQIDSDPENVETETLPDQNDVQTNGHSDLDNPTQQKSHETAVPLQEDPDDSQAEDEVVSDEIPPDEEPDADGELSENVEPAEEVPQNSPAADKNENDLVALDDDEIDDEINETPAKEETSVTAKEEKEDVGEVQSETGKTEDKNPAELNGSGQEEKNSETSAKSQNGEKSAKGALSSKKILIAALIVLMISGVFIYAKPSLTGIKEKVEPVPEAKSQTREPVEPAQIQTPKPKPPGKYDKYLAKLEEADRLREALLEKKEEIYKLKLHYRNGIAELMDQVGREIQEAGISSYAQALENKRIELFLRTIQRRQVYIKALEKPDRWLHNGSEELLFLKRKAQLDFQMVDIVGGIDLNRHLRYINAAIQKYQPSAEKLAVAPPPADLRPLETIWNEINNQQMNKATTTLGHKDGNIIEEICSGNFKHITELSVITAMAARCLSKNSGSDLFLNGLTQLSPDEARYLFQWQGNWICLNSVKKLAPAAAKYLFEWEGNWISLNGLTEFPPELALYLMEWRGSQLELMGLNYDKKKPDPRALKYLALWETMGGKLFVSEGIRKEMKRVM